MTGTNAFSAADLVAVIPEVWTPKILEELFAKAVLSNFCTNLSPFADEGDTLHVPDVYTNSFTVQTQSTPGSEVTLGSPTQVDVTLSTNNHIYIAYILGDAQLSQIAKSYDVNAIYAKKAGATLIDDLESDLAALWSGLSTNVVGDTATVLTDLEIRKSVEKLASANFPLNECAWFFHPYVYWNQILGVQKYYDQSQFAAPNGQSPVYTGNFGPADVNRGLQGRLYGIPVFTTSNIVSGLKTYRNLLLHKDAFGFAIQIPRLGGQMVRTRAAEWLANLGVLVVHDMFNGTAELRDAAGVVVNANTTATTS